MLHVWPKGSRFCCSSPQAGVVPWIWVTAGDVRPSLLLHLECQCLYQGEGSGSFCFLLKSEKQIIVIFHLQRKPQSRKALLSIKLTSLLFFSPLRPGKRVTAQCLYVLMKQELRSHANKCFLTRKRVVLSIALKALTQTKCQLLNH